MPLTQGQHLNDRYWIAALVEQGGFGAVYKAWDITLNRPVAIKESYEDSAAGQRQFLREAQLLANLAHPNLPRVIDFFAIPDQAQYLVMEFIEGMNLEELRVLAGGQLQMTQALGWTSQVLDALSYIHRQNPPVIHRDIKPTNIKVTPPDEDYPQGRAVLVDFGTAKAYEPSKRTTMGARAVTPGYSPHEQYGQANILTDARTDIYALGATLYMLLTGQEPPESVTRLLLDPLLPPRQLNPALPPELEATILKAMHNDPDERFQTAGQFKAAIQDLLAVGRSQPSMAGSQQIMNGNQHLATSISPPAVSIPRSAFSEPQPAMMTQTPSPQSVNAGPVSWLQPIRQSVAVTQNKTESKKKSKELLAIPTIVMATTWGIFGLITGQVGNDFEFILPIIVGISFSATIFLAIGKKLSKAKRIVAWIPIPPITSSIAVHGYCGLQWWQAFLVHTPIAVLPYIILQLSYGWMYKDGGYPITTLNTFLVAFPFLIAGIISGYCLGLQLQKAERRWNNTI